MVSWDCPNCNGTGQEKVLIVRSSGVETTYETCRDCGGKGEVRG